jgi:peptide/nickel transport system permease protein
VNTRAKLAAVAALILTVYAVVLCAGFFAPYAPDEQDRMASFSPPMSVRLIDDAGRFHWRPFVYSASGGEENHTSRSMYPLRMLASGSPYTIAGVFHCRAHLFAVDHPGRIYLLGTDGYGRDQFSRLLYGGQTSLLAGLLATTLSLSLGLILGAVAGFYGRIADNVLMRLAELFLALPWLYLLLALRAFLPLHTDTKTAYLLLIGVIGFVGWANPARLVRGIVLTAKERNYVLAAQGFGASRLYLLARHVLPETYPVLLTQAALLMPQYVLAEVSLSFFGLGIAEPVPSWGNMLASLQQYHVLARYWWMLAPAFVLVPLFLAYHVFGDLLREHLQCAS